MGTPVSTPRVVAIVGPYTSGKSTLFESLLATSDDHHPSAAGHGAFAVADGSPEARDREMSTDLSVASTRFLGDDWVLLDCPGSVEFLQDSHEALMVADLAIVVIEPDPARAAMLVPLLKFLDDRFIPHMIFINKADRDGTTISIRACLDALQQISERPLVLREVPIREGEQIVGYVDLVSERAYRYRPGEASALIQVPDSVSQRTGEARQGLLEQLADYDDVLMEKLLEDMTPPAAEVYDDLRQELAADLVVPVFFGAAAKNQGVRRLWKALRHDTPSHQTTARRLGLSAPAGTTLATVFKTLHGRPAGKLSLLRLWSGSLKDGQSLLCDGETARVSGLYSLQGQESSRLPALASGGIAAAGRLDAALTGSVLAERRGVTTPPWPPALPPLFAQTLLPTRSGDDVKLSSALARLCEEDRSLSVGHATDGGGLLLWGQGDIHLAIACARLHRLFHVEVTRQSPHVPWQETFRGSCEVHGRFKRQSGGHGQFADVLLRLSPLPRGTGIEFVDSITGGAIPRNFIPAVEAGVREWAEKGPLGFPVTDFRVELVDGSWHVVDSSEAAFKAAAGMAMREGAGKCSPVLLEPILWVEACVPTDSTSRAQRALSGRRGQILGFLPREGWRSWDAVQAWLPLSEMHDLITELRSLTMGTGTFSWKFDHMQELEGKLAEQVIEQRKKEE